MVQIPIKDKEGRDSTLCLGWKVREELYQDTRRPDYVDFLGDCVYQATSHGVPGWGLTLTPAIWER